jgi:hypothetical protein
VVDLSLESVSGVTAGTVLGVSDEEKVALAAAVAAARVAVVTVCPGGAN